MKKHWVNFTATLYGSILIEGDESPESAAKYAKRHLSFSGEAEGVDAEINEQQITIEEAYAAPPTAGQRGEK
jgi:hypothetical protein